MEYFEIKELLEVLALKTVEEAEQKLREYNIRCRDDRGGFYKMSYILWQISNMLDGIGL